MSEADMMEPLQYCIDDLTVNWFLPKHLAATNAHKPQSDPTLFSSIDYQTKNS